MNMNKVIGLVWKIVALATGILFLGLILMGVIGAGVSFLRYKMHSVEGVAVEAGKNKPDLAGLKVIVQYELPLSVNGLDHFIVPITLEKKKVGETRPFASSPRMSSYSDYSDSRYFSEMYGPFYNLVFIDKTTGVSKLLLEQKGFIQNVCFPEKSYSEKEDKTPPTFIFYRMALVDTNGDGVLNEKDALPGYVSNADGTHLSQVTPANTSVTSWRYDPEGKKLFIEVIRDLNQDRKFNWDDPKTILAVNVLDPKLGDEIVPVDLKAKAEAILK